ncbi:DNRLRE domain-containing protein, partial [Nocardioides acrostichi]
DTADGAAGGQGLSYSYDVAASAGVVPSVDAAGDVVFTDTTDAQAGPNGDGVVFTIPRAFMVDSAVPEPAYTDAVDYAIDPASDTAGTGWVLTMTPDTAWLADAARVYPVLIDPTVNFGPPATDCWIRSDVGTGSFCGDGSGYLRVGTSTQGAKFRSVMRFDVSNVPTGSVVTSAALELYLDASKSGSSLSASYSVYRAGVDFNTAATWTNSGIESWNGGNPSGTPLGTTTLNGTSSGYRTFTDLGDYAQGWVDQSLPNKGLVVKQTQEDTENVLWFYSSSTTSANDSRRPRFIVDYQTPAVGTDAVGDYTADGPEDSALLSSSSVVADEREVDWIASNLEGDEDPSITPKGCVDDDCQIKQSKYLTVKNHKEGAGNPCTSGDSGCSSQGHPFYTCSAAATRNMVETFTGTDKGEAWFVNKFDLGPQGLEGIKHISKTLRSNWSDEYKHTWVKRTPTGPIKYQARIIADIKHGFPVVQDIATEYLPYWNNHALTHYNIAYGYDKLDKTVAIAEEWNPYFTYGVTPPYGNPYGLHATVPRSKAFAAVYHSPNHAIVF